jgi:hypothetical protein
MEAKSVSPGFWYFRPPRVEPTPTAQADADPRAFLAVTAALVLAVTGACTGNQTNGLEKKAAAEVQQDAAAALKAAKTVRVTGATLSQGRRVRLDLRLQDGRSSGVVMLTGAQAEFTAIGSDFYLKGNQQVWQALLAPPPVEGFAGQWVKLRSEQVTLDLISIESLAAQLTDNAWRLQPKVEQATLGDRKVVVLSQQDGSRLYVANTGPAHPLRIDHRKPDGWQVDLAEHGADLQVAAPSNSLSNGLTPAESAWLDKVEKLTATMEKAFEAIPTYLSASALTTAATRLRGCNQELARIGSPSYRLEPVHALAERACAKYEKGAQCFASAARIGIPRAGSAAERKLDSAIRCGFASSEASVMLRDAMNTGDEIRSKLS